MRVCICVFGLLIGIVFAHAQQLGVVLTFEFADKGQGPITHEIVPGARPQSLDAVLIGVASVVGFTCKGYRPYVKFPGGGGGHSPKLCYSKLIIAIKYNMHASDVH